jgi:uncharacterized membrane protein
MITITDMIESTASYLAVVFTLGGGLWAVERRAPLKVFTWLPAIVLVYLISIGLSQSGLFAHNSAQTDAYKTLKSWLLPMMLFLMMLRLDLRAFAGLGKQLLIAYAGAVLSLTFSFFTVFVLFGFGPDAAGVFGALSGSWTGGTANMLAVAGALNIPSSQLGPALIVDSLLYTLWVSALLLAVPLAPYFDRWSDTGSLAEPHGTDPVRPPSVRTLLFLGALALASAFVLRLLAPWLPLLPAATWLVLLATFAGAAGSFTPLRHAGGSATLSSLLLYLLIALIGSHASLQGFDDVPRYLAAAAAVLLLHALLMVVLARAFKLSLFSIGIASLANIGGVASAPILAAAYHRHLVGAAVIMAVMGYLVGTLVGLLIASGLGVVAA